MPCLHKCLPAACFTVPYSAIFATFVNVLSSCPSPLAFYSRVRNGFKRPVDACLERTETERRPARGLLNIQWMFV